MNGPDCPIHHKPMGWLSTWNQWEYYCEACDKRYNRNMKTMPPLEDTIPTTAPSEKPTKQLYYRNKKIQDCTHEELVLCCAWLAKRLDEERGWHQETIEMEQLFRDANEKIRSGRP